MANIEIPTSVTSIGGAAFDGTLWIEEKRKENPLVIVNNILIDGEDCKGDVKIPSGVTMIGDSAFSYCDDLTSIEIPTSVTSIGDDAFGRCRGLTSMEIPLGVVTIGNHVFSACSGLKNIEIPTSVETIGYSAFWNCDALTSVEMPASVTTIEYCAFCECSSLKSIEVPSSVTSIGEIAFRNYGFTAIVEKGFYAEQYMIEEHVSYKYKESGNLENATVTLSATSCTYNGKAQEPSVTVTLDGKNLVNGTDYTVTYLNNKNIGTAKVTIE